MGRKRGAVQRRARGSVATCRAVAQRRRTGAIEPGLRSGRAELMADASQKRTPPRRGQELSRGLVRRLAVARAALILVLLIEELPDRLGKFVIAIGLRELDSAADTPLGNGTGRAELG